MALRATALFVLLAALFLLGAPGDVQAVNVTFELDALLTFGNGFVIAGSVDELGNWNVSEAAFLTVTGDRFWTVTVDLEAGATVEYKPVLIVYDTREILEWYPNNNIVLSVPSEGPAYEYIYFPGVSTCTPQQTNLAKL